MICEYEEKYREEVKDLLVELQEYIVSIDREGYNILTVEYRDRYFTEVMDEVSKNQGKILLYKNNDKIEGMIVGVINNEEDSYSFKAPKRGRINELIVSKRARAKGIGSLLLKAMEKYLTSAGCKGILIEVFGYNGNGIKFYEKHGYNTRLLDMSKVVE